MSELPCHFIVKQKIFKEIYSRVTITRKSHLLYAGTLHHNHYLYSKTLSLVIASKGIIISSGKGLPF